MHSTGYQTLQNLSLITVSWRSLHSYLFVWNFMNLLRQRIIRLCYFCKMVINKTIVIGISLSNRICQYEFNASIDFCKITSQVHVIAPSTVLTSDNAKLLPSHSLCHSLMLFVQHDHSAWGSVKHFADPPVLVEPSWLRINRRSCRKWIRRNPPTLRKLRRLFFKLIFKLMTSLLSTSTTMFTDLVTNTWYLCISSLIMIYRFEIIMKISWFCL